MSINIFYVFLLVTNIVYIRAENCKLSDKCRLVDINGDDEWIKTSGHYRNIQDCIDDALPGDTCIIRSGRYHELLSIENKENLVIRGDLDYERPIIDGTIELSPIDSLKDDNVKDKSQEWNKEYINGKLVCTSEISIIDDKHPFQLFLRDDNNQNEFEMMTNARWPNALWNEKDSETGTPKVFYNEFWGKSDGNSTRGKMVDRAINGSSPLASSGLDMKGAMAILNVGFWNTFVKPVKEHNAGENFFTYEDDFGDIRFEPDKNQYYLDSSEILLDNPGEWYYNMNTRILKFMPWTDSCPSSNSGSVRGRVIDYSMTISKTDGLRISDIDFFASNIYAVPTLKNETQINELYLDSVRFKFASSSKRMLQDYNVPKITQIAGGFGGTIYIDNCEFVGAEGSALLFWGKNVKIRNNLFQWNDWSGQMGLKASGGFGTIYSGPHASDTEFADNTMWYNGASAGYRPGYGVQRPNHPKTINNLIIGQCAGNIMNDGVCIQIQVFKWH